MTDTDQKKITDKKFTIKESSRLLQLVRDYGTNNWNEIAKHMPNRNARACKKHWNMCIKSTLTKNLDKNQFTIEEDILLVNKVNEIGTYWREISEFFKHRSHTQLMNRYNKYLKTNLDEKGNLNNDYIYYRREIQRIQQQVQMQQQMRIQQMQAQQIQAQQMQAQQMQQQTQAQQILCYELDDAIKGMLGGDNLNKFLSFFK